MFANPNKKIECKILFFDTSKMLIGKHGSSPGKALHSIRNIDKMTPQHI